MKNTVWMLEYECVKEWEGKNMNVGLWINK